MNLERRLVEALRLPGILHRGVRLLVAASGGLDSTVLAHLLRAIATNWDALVTLAYIDHGLRSAAEDEARFVSALAAELGYSVLVAKIPLPAQLEENGKANVQDRARALRYEALERLRTEAGAEWILTAHHADDQAETVLLRLLRGSGPTGLAGIRPVADRIARPLLFAAKSDLLTWATMHGIAWREDESNASDAYARNALRRHVMPALRAYGHPHPEKPLAEAADIARSAAEFHAARTAELAAACFATRDGALHLAVPALREYFDFERRLLIRQAILQVRGTEAGYDETLAVLGLLDRRPGATVRLSDRLMATRERQTLVFADTIPPCAERSVALGDAVDLSDGRFESAAVPLERVAFTGDRGEEYVDLDACGGAWASGRSA